MLLFLSPILCGSIFNVFPMACCIVRENLIVVEKVTDIYLHSTREVKNINSGSDFHVSPFILLLV